jgi:MFS family permease
LQIYNWIVPIIAALLAERAGRRRLFLASSCSMLVFMVMVLACSAVYANNGSHAAGTAVIVFLFLFLGGYVIGFTSIPLLYVNEIWPTDLRAKGTIIYWFSPTVALCFNQYVNLIALKEIRWKYYFVYVGVLVAVIAFIFFYIPETKGLPLEEVRGIFDRQDADVIAHSTDIVSGKKEGPSMTLVDEVA